MPPSDPARGPLSSRSPAILAGALVPLVIGEAVILSVLSMAASHSAPLREAGPLASLMLMLPGSLLIGAIFAFPISATLVCAMSWLMRRTRHAGHLLAWVAAGAVFSLPASLVLWSLDGPGTPVCLLFGLALGLLGGGSAWSKRPEQQRRP